MASLQTYLVEGEVVVVVIVVMIPSGRAYVGGGGRAQRDDEFHQGKGSCMGSVVVEFGWWLLSSCRL